jgi:hypothetical protein
MPMIFFAAAFALPASSGTADVSGYKNSPYYAEFPSMHARVKRLTAFSFGNSTSLGNSTYQFDDYPNIGRMPKIDLGLSFLPKNIVTATVAVAGQKNGYVGAYWVGRNPNTVQEMWSSTKSLLFPFIISKGYLKAGGDMNHWKMGRFSIPHIISDIESYKYEYTGLSSNCLSSSLKLLVSRLDQEMYLKSITGNSALQFQGGYGEPACITEPLTENGNILLSAQTSTFGANEISSYDMVRMYSNMFWMNMLKPEQKIPGLSFAGPSDITPIIEGMTRDDARYFDVAVAQLGIKNNLKEIVVLSKLGMGPSNGKTDSIYAAFIQYFQIDKQTYRSFAVCLKASDYGETAANKGLIDSMKLIIERINNEAPLR